MPEQQNLAGKVALVTGSGRGIGAGIALRLASHGADVVINYHSSPDRAQKVAEQARSLGVKAICVKADVSKKADIVALFETAKKELGRIDIVMSNSGIEHFGEVESVKEEEIDRVFSINVKGQFFVAQEAHRYLEKNGRLILISSISAVMGIRRHAIYAASKAAVQGMVKCLAYDFGSRGITVNAVAPGGIKTDMWTEAAAEYIEGGKDMTAQQVEDLVARWSPLNRAGEVDDVAGVVALLASAEAQWITGQTMHVSGGAHMV